MVNPVHLSPAEGRIFHVLQEEVRVLADGAATAGEFEVFVVGGQQDSGAPLHFHPWAEAVYILAGEMEQTTDGVVRRLMPGSFVLTPGGVVHGYRILSAHCQFLVLTAKAGAGRFFEAMDQEVVGLADFARVVEVALHNDVRLAG